MDIKKLLIIISFFISPYICKANIACMAEDGFYNYKINIIDDKPQSILADVAITDTRTDTVIFANVLYGVSHYWDGYLTGLYTHNRGFSMKYNSNYGCVTDVAIVFKTSRGLLKQMDFAECAGSARSLVVE